MFSSKNFTVSGLTFRSLIPFEFIKMGQNGHHQKNLPTINAGEDVQKRESSCTISGNVN